MQLAAFAPLYDNSSTGKVVDSVTATVAVASTAVTVQLPARAAGQRQVQISNTIAGWAYVSFGNAAGMAAAAAATSYPIPPNSTAIVTVDDQVQYASAVSGTTGAVIFTRGDGT